MHAVTRNMAWAHGAIVALLLSGQCAGGEPPGPGDAGDQGGVKEGEAPVLSVPDLGKNLGRVIQGAVVSYRVWYENAGGRPLVLKRVLPTCGTKLKDWDPKDRTVPAGSRGSFELELDTTGATKGPRCLCAQIQSNDPRTPELCVHFWVTVETPVEIEPARPSIQWLPDGPGETEIALSGGAPELKILAAKSESGRLALELRETPPGPRYRLRASTLGSRAERSSALEKVELVVAAGERRLSQRFVVLVYRRERIESTPPEVHFTRKDLEPLKGKGRSVRKAVEIGTPLPAPYRFQIRRADADAAAQAGAGSGGLFKCEIEPVEEGRRYRVVVTVDALPAPLSTSKPTTVKGEIRLATDDPKQPELRITCSCKAP